MRVGRVELATTDDLLVRFVPCIIHWIFIVDFFLLIEGMQFVLSYSYYTLHLDSNSEYCIRTG